MDINVKTNLNMSNRIMKKGIAGKENTKPHNADTENTGKENTKSENASTENTAV